MKTTTQQFAILKKYFPHLVESQVPEGSGYLIPKWQTLSGSYMAATETVFSYIAGTRSFYNWREKEMGGLRESVTKIKAMKNLPDFMLLNVQLGEKYKGRSVKDVREAIRVDNEETSSTEFGLGAYEVAIILLTHPDTLKSYSDLWIDCPGDEFKPTDGSEFSRAPYFRFRGGRLEFGATWVSSARGLCGSASAFLPQSNLASRNLEPLESLNLEDRIKALEEWRERVRS